MFDKIDIYKNGCFDMSILNCIKLQKRANCKNRAIIRRALVDLRFSATL